MLFIYQATTGCLLRNGIVCSYSKAQAIIDVQRTHEIYTNFEPTSILVEEIDLEEGDAREMKCEKIGSLL